MITATEYKKAFLDEYGFDLEDSSILPDEQFVTQSAKVERFYKRVKKMVDVFIRKYNINFDTDKMTVRQTSAYNEALLEQGLYILKSGDVSLMAGFDPVTNVMVDLDELKRRIIAPSVQDLLIQCGVCNRAIRTSRHITNSGELL